VAVGAPLTDSSEEAIPLKVVIPAAGLGSRFLPATKSMPKEMLPVLNRPVIQYVVEEAVAAGADDILIVTGRGKRALEDHFDQNPDLGELKERPALRELESLANRATIHFVRQPTPRGLADALARAEKHVAGQPFGVLLGDSIHLCQTPLLAQLRGVFERTGARSSVVALEVVPEDRVSQYGIVGGREISPGLIEVDTLVEKPSPREAPSRMAITGAYFLTPRIFDAIRSTPPGRGGEVQLTDALVVLRRSEKIYGCVFEGQRHDTGTPLLWLEANARFALAHPEYRESLLRIFREMESASQPASVGNRR
jgi:UTP--glucose-1-phosphate uridylyltransferase